MLIDGMAIVYRAYYALNRSPRLNSKGMNTSAVLGFTTTLYDLMRQQHPTHVGVAFDLQAPTFRHEEYEPYKANRDAMPEDIQHGLPYIHKILAAFGIPVLTCEGYEADDVVGTMSVLAEQNGFDEVLMVTPDKDFAQLVTPRTRLYRFGRGGKPDEIYGPEEVCEHFGVSRPKQVIDILGLWGDSIDNIPGIPGVGEKKAKQLVEEFGSIEELVRRADEIRNEKLRLLVQQHADQALLSKHLATIVLNAPVAFDEEALARTEPDYAALRGLFDELEFRAFARKFFTDLSVTDPEAAAKFSQPIKSEVPKTKANAKVEPDTAQMSLFGQPSLFEEPVSDGSAEGNSVAESVTVTTIESLATLPDGGDVSLFFQGTQVAVSTSADNAFCCEVSSLDLPAFKTLMENPNTIKVCYDLKAVKYRLMEMGITIQGDLFDVMLAHYLIEPELRHSYDFICSAVLGVEPADATSAAAFMWGIYPLQISQLREAKLMNIYTDIELPLVDVLISMEQEGVRIDVEALRAYSQQLAQQRNDIEGEIYALAGQIFNIGSPKQLGEVLYEKLQITSKPPRTATKQYSTAEDVLLRLADKHPIVPLILEYRSINKLIGTYLDSFPKLISPTTGRLHTVYNQAVTATGRLSSSNPNLQNIPIRTEKGREIRKAFVPRDKNHILLAADYSQIELRIIAALADDDNMISSFTHRYDIHAATAAKIYHIPIDEVSKEQRRNAKSVNFGIIYGISAFGLAEQLGIPRAEAKELIDEYFQQYPKIRQFIDSSIDFARQNGYARTILGRRRYLADINSRNHNLQAFAERNAVNMPIQGTSADMIKLAMISIYRQLNQRGLKSKMILQVHDELVFDVVKSELAEVRTIVEQAMLTALPLSIPIEVGIETGQNWLEAH